MIYIAFGHIYCQVLAVMFCITNSHLLQSSLNKYYLFLVRANYELLVQTIHVLLITAFCTIFRTAFPADVVFLLKLHTLNSGLACFFERYELLVTNPSVHFLHIDVNCFSSHTHLYITQMYCSLCAQSNSSPYPADMLTCSCNASLWAVPYSIIQLVLKQKQIWMVCERVLVPTPFSIFFWRFSRVRFC